MLGGIAEAFRDANFRRYSVGSVVSWLSFFVQAVAIAWVTWTLTHSTKWLAIVALLDAAPMGLLAPLGGVVADRYDRFRVLMLAYALATLHALALALLAFSGELTLGWLCGLALFHGVVHAFSVPAAFGLLPRFVAPQRLASAIAVSSAYTQLGFFAGPALAGVVLAHFGPGVAFASNVLGYLVFFASAARLRTPAHYEPPPPRGQAFARDFLDGIEAIRAHAGVRGLLALMLFGDALAASVRQMLPALSDRSLHAGVEGYSTLLTCAGIGATLAALWIAHGGRRRLKSGFVLAAFVGHVAATLVLLSVGSLAAAGLAMTARGASVEICRTGTVGLLQTSTPDALRGRIMSAQFLLQQGASALGVALVGGVADRFGLFAPLLTASMLAFGAWLMVVRQRGAIEAAFTLPAAPPRAPAGH